MVNTSAAQSDIVIIVNKLYHHMRLNFGVTVINILSFETKKKSGLSCFRKAIFLDPRHYNAWYGISMIHLKQEKYLLAEKYLKKLTIFVTSSNLN